MSTGSFQNTPGLSCYRELGNKKAGKLLIKWEKPWDALSLIPKGVDGVGQVSDVLKSILKQSSNIFLLKTVWGGV